MRVAVLIVAFNGRRYLPDCLASLRAAERRTAESSVVDWTVYVLDNASDDDTSQLVIEQFPECRLIRSEKNLGFAEGNNFLWRHARSEEASWGGFFLLNQDTVVDEQFLVQAVEYLRLHPDAGACQALLLLHPETGRINTAGNRLHFLGIGLPTRYREAADSKDLCSGEIDYPSGAAVLIRSELIGEPGFFEPSLFMYLEDAELGWRLHLLGRPPHVCIDSVVYHKYQFGSTMRSYFYLERNRWWLVATHYRLATLALLLPALLLMECGQLVYAVQQNVLRAKFFAIAGFFHPSFLRSLVATRRRMQRERVIRDCVILRRWSGTLRSPHLASRLLQVVANPIFSAYRWALIHAVRW